MSNISSNILRILENSYLNPTDKALMRCEVAKELETAGDYEGARDALGELWLGVGQRPRLDGLDEKARALLLLHAGSLTGWLGSSGQVAGSQEAAKDLISESIRELEALGMTSKVCEAQSEMALCYWREGSFDDARIILGQARERLDEIGEESKYAELKALILIRSAIVEFKAKRFEEALQFLRQAEPLAEAGDNDVLKGKLHVELALTLRNLASGNKREEYMDLALVEYSAASFFFEQAGHVRYSARVENNVGYLLFTLGRFAEAHEHLDHAEKLFLRLRDKGSAAQVKETRAQVYLAEGKVADAERSARWAVEALKEGSENAVLAEAQTTLGVALARHDLAGEARRMFEYALIAAQEAGDLEGAGKAALSLVEELGKSLPLPDLCAAYERAEHLLCDTTSKETVERLRSCARSIISGIKKSSVSGVPPSLVAEGEMTVEDESNLPLPEAVRRYEARLISDALRESGGSVTKAAQRLGVGHQTLSAILHQRHQELLAMKKPRKRRQVSIILRDRK
jgi:tetratricopeptide (TPR) repeat protein